MAEKEFVQEKGNAVYKEYIAVRNHLSVAFPLPGYEIITDKDGTPKSINPNANTSWRGKLWHGHARHSRTMYPFHDPDGAGVAVLTSDDQKWWQPVGATAKPWAKLPMGVPIQRTQEAIKQIELGISPVVLTSSKKEDKSVIEAIKTRVLARVQSKKGKGK